MTGATILVTFLRENPLNLNEKFPIINPFRTNHSIFQYLSRKRDIRTKTVSVGPDTTVFGFCETISQFLSVFFFSSLKVGFDCIFCPRRFFVRRFFFFFFCIFIFFLSIMSTLFRTAVPTCGQTAQTLSRLDPKRDCTPKRVNTTVRVTLNPLRTAVPILAITTLILSRFPLKRDCSTINRRVYY